MASRELVVLGTASQVPTRHRNHNGYLLRWDGEALLFDPGEGTQRQMGIHHVSASRLTAILVTHFHGDHCLGLPGMLQRMALDGATQAVDACFPASGAEHFERLRLASIARAQAAVREHPIAGDGLTLKRNGLHVEARRLDHPVDTFRYRVQEAEGRSLVPERLEAAGVRGPAAGELVRRGRVEVSRGRVVRLEDVSVPRPGQSMAFVMDTRPCRAAVELARGADLLVCESTYLEAEARLAHEHGHMTAADAARVARDAGARRLVLTHYSSRYRTLEGFAEEAAAIHGDVVVAEDGALIPVPRRLRPRPA